MRCALRIVDRNGSIFWASHAYTRDALKQLAGLLAAHVGRLRRLGILDGQRFTRIVLRLALGRLGFKQLLLGQIAPGRGLVGVDLGLRGCLKTIVASANLADQMRSPFDYGQIGAA